jgi:peptidoglycan/xylan/chitin deacetylase (PgdA/CDA1 family)
MLRHRVTWWLDRLGVVDVLRRRRKSGSELSILTYHRVSDLPDGYAFDDGVIDATPKAFAEQLQWLRKSCTLVDLDTVREALASGEPLPPNAVLITFDDGYLDNRTGAAPILADVGATATFFIATRFIEERKLFWWDRIAYAIKHTRATRLRLGYPTELTFELPRQAALAVSTLSTLVKETHGIDVERLLDGLYESAGVPWSAEIERQHADELLMRWDDIRALADAGMSIQSHTRTHRTIHSLPTDVLTDELTASRRELQEQLGGRDVYALAYPVGHDVSALESVTPAVRAAGYEVAFTNATGPASLAENDRYWMPRIAMDLGTPAWHFRSVVAVPQLARAIA